MNQQLSTDYEKSNSKITLLHPYLPLFHDPASLGQGVLPETWLERICTSSFQSFFGPCFLMNNQLQSSTSRSWKLGCWERQVWEVKRQEEDGVNGTCYGGVKSLFWYFQVITCDSWDNFNINISQLAIMLFLNLVMVKNKLKAYQI